MYFVGIDLAWSSNNPSGVAVIEQEEGRGKLVHVETVETDEEIIDAVEEQVGEDSAFVTIDAPLVVPNETGRRPAEEQVGELFRKYNAGAHPANRNRLSQWTGRVRGEEIAELLEESGFDHTPHIEDRETDRIFFEVYPHPSMVVLFDLETVLPYKKKGGRDYETVWEAFKKYQQFMKDLKDEEPSFEAPEILDKEIEGVRGKELKEYEDKLDAVFCAYIAQYAWSKPEKCAVLGNFEEGYIFTPVFDDMQEKIKRMQSQTTLESYSED